MNNMETVSAERVAAFSEKIAAVKKELAKDVVGQADIIENVLIAIVAGGNVLLEGVPCVGKTRLVRSLGRALELPFSRIQFTPDLMPSDITGTNVIEKDDAGKLNTVFRKGPIFANLVLADEINRATPKTQSALLEAMQEHTVTVMGVSRKLEEPFFVLATQNPVEQDGTYPLPEAQMDRFMFKIIVKNPSLDELMDIVNMTQKTMAEVADAACNGQDLLEMRATANQIPVAEEVMRYAMQLCSATHPDSECASEVAKKYVRLGASPRAGQALISAAKVKALMNGRYNVSYGDVNELAYPVLRHRMKLTFEAIAERVSADEIISMIIDEVMVRNKLKDEPVKAENDDNETKKRGLFGRK
jgi:MoxR-like ATPase